MNPVQVACPDCKAPEDGTCLDEQGNIMLSYQVNRIALAEQQKLDQTQHQR